MKTHHVVFEKLGRTWTAMLFSDANTCVSWVPVGNRRNVDRLCTRLTASGTPFEVVS